MTMQDVGFVEINQIQIKVLRRMNDTQGRTRAHGITLKRRISGKPGKFLAEESVFLADRPDLVARLLDGETVNL